jgi:hypothetical protein
MSGFGANARADARIALARDVLARSGALSLRATGGSMLPAIAPGDLLTFRKSTGAAIAPGQVVLLRSDDRLVAHRMVGERAGTIVTRGDALDADDAVHQHADVLGVLVAQQRGQRRLHPGGRHWLRRQRIARWTIRRSGLLHRLFRQLPVFLALLA